MARTADAAAEWATWPKERRQYIPYPGSWLNAGEYLNEPEATAASVAEPTARDPRSIPEGEWRGIVEGWRKTGRWVAAYWGPPPGEPGCFVPPSLVVSVAATALPSVGKYV